ncbi:DDE-type integrase/transposase/recombinase [Prauserella halophila]|nr:DDE-type integrase/transposase/recombinase [Prauserella halophila]
MIRQAAGMPVSRFVELVGIPRRSYTRWLARERAGGGPGKGPWPAPAVEAAEPIVEKYAQVWPAWGHRKIYGLLVADGYDFSASTVERAMRRRNLLQPVTYQRERRQLAAARKAAFADQPSRPYQVWQLDFSEYETITGGVWRLAGCADYYSKYEFGWHVATTSTAADAIAAVELAIAEAERLVQRPLLEQQTDPDTGEIRPVMLVTDNGSAFTSVRFERFLRTRPELSHVRTRANTPGQNGVRERAFGSLKYEHLYRLEIDDGQSLATEAEQYRQVFNHTRPHEALGLRRPAEVHHEDQQTQASTASN